MSSDRKAVVRQRPFTAEEVLFCEVFCRYLADALNEAAATIHPQELSDTEKQALITVQKERVSRAYRQVQKTTVLPEVDIKLRPNGNMEIHLGGQLAVIIEDDDSGK